MQNSKLIYLFYTDVPMFLILYLENMFGAMVTMLQMLQSDEWESPLLSTHYYTRKS